MQEQELNLIRTPEKIEVYGLTRRKFEGTILYLEQEFEQSTNKAAHEKRNATVSSRSNYHQTSLPISQLISMREYLLYYVLN